MALRWQPVAPYAIEIGRQAQRVTVQARCIPALLISKKHYKVGFFKSFCHGLSTITGACSRFSADRLAKPKRETS